jgi:hypothetical protein
MGPAQQLVARMHRRLRRNRDFREVFGTDAGKHVLQSLAIFCHADTSLHVPGDPHSTANLTGKRDVLLYIQQRIGMTDAEVIELAKAERAQARME